MAERSMSFNGVHACAGAPGFKTLETAFNEAVVREQYRSLARLGPYVHGVVIVAALSFFCATGANWLAHKRDSVACGAHRSIRLSPHFLVQGEGQCRD